MEFSYTPKLNLFRKLCILFVSFFTLLCFAGLLQGGLLTTSLSQRTVLLIGSVMQNLMAFILPAVIVAWLSKPSAPMRYLGATTAVSWKWIAAAVVLFILMLPALNQIIFWNAHFTFPSSMSGIETTMREWEQNAAEMTEVILAGNSWSTLISGVLIVGVITGIAEETFFRAGLQKAFTSAGVNPHIAVWGAAFIFSAVHFQFFGFIPRLLLGAMFGYLYYYSGSLWTAAFVHALNNSIVVVCSWLSARGAGAVNPEQIGVSSTGISWLFVLSCLATTLFIILLIRKHHGAKEL